ncbi:bifunctional indole-3-glycerol-phosphate synthase TrpC/phosphoribosylanthranilate isomerase TrpF [Dictyobacter arantiisoli]|uniref:Multifunctional fusion protein n=1 Tax=Dictyobacter arantiisoli TaxID=2014874 RepID=A0A5A5T9N8_9CHLR|nr:bifunctional indole-3-glycerol-phosphate synthase TrpC/phosphoribosylanthranilate isomerase TrpF [Dictyobacter arantiisoli]GCF08047.1 tryptophan biosynthesis protein TrpCF [Dictyobacter arantiisoli]
MFLDKIVNQTRLDLAQRKIEHPIEELQRLAFEQSSPRDVLEAFEPRDQVHLIAEVKRASPSKGLLAPDLDPVATALLYEQHGAAMISVLTEPHFFLGSPEYLTAIKHAVSIPVLRKDFIIDDYQVYEARAWGADAILLICAILDDEQLRHLLHLAHSLRMRALVEVHSRAEAQRAVDAGAMIIGVNSRDLVTFKMNPYLIREIRQMLPANRIIVAESGIHSPADVRRLARYDVQAMLVGESLVVSPDMPGQIRMLLHGANRTTQVKICGLRDAEHIDAAIEAGADMLGFIFHAPSQRYIAPERIPSLLAASNHYAHIDEGQVLPDLVGVFVNKEAAYINDVAEQAGLHYIQLHGTETPEFCQQIKRPVIKALSLTDKADLHQLADYQAVTWRLLIDTPTPEWGGSGRTSDWDLAYRAAQQEKILLAGGLTVGNVADAIQQVHPWGLDVSSGVETDKRKDVQKIHAFLQQVRQSEKDVALK